MWGMRVQQFTGRELGRCRIEVWKLRKLMKILSSGLNTSLGFRREGEAVERSVAMVTTLPWETGWRNKTVQMEDAKGLNCRTPDTVRPGKGTAAEKCKPSKLILSSQTLNGEKKPPLTTNVNSMRVPRNVNRSDYL